ncbi:SART-1 family protein [Fragilaria crotonensis]|nr:SART-1 family protein [Fragilaria crotonensis]
MELRQHQRLGGMAGVLAMLRHTGEISGRNAGREELRGRAKDERTYEDYAPLNLKEVVRIGKGATDKDRELASREIKLDYRDEHGRLLTRKEAYRNLCYQFHGHGSSAKNEERRLRQIEREQSGTARIAAGIRRRFPRCTEGDSKGNRKGICCS